jgi:hypothetical protein
MVRLSAQERCVEKEVTNPTKEQLTRRLLARLSRKVKL